MKITYSLWFDEDCGCQNLGTFNDLSSVLEHQLVELKKRMALNEIAGDFDSQNLEWVEDKELRDKQVSILRLKVKFADGAEPFEVTESFVIVREEKYSIWEKLKKIIPKIIPKLK